MAEPQSKVLRSNSVEKGLGGLESADVWGDQDDVSLDFQIEKAFILILMLWTKASMENDVNQKFYSQ